MSTPDPQDREFDGITREQAEDARRAGLRTEFGSAVVPARTTLVLNAYHAAQGDQPTGIDAQLSWPTDEIEEEAYRRQLKSIGSEWVPVDLGWLADNKIGHMILRNTSGLGQRTIRDKEAEAQHRQRVIWWRVKGNEMGLGIPPGGFAVISPGDKLIEIRATVPGVSGIVWAAPA